TFDKPSFNVYNALVKDHGDTLQCQCSLISSTYNQYVQLEPIFHPICSSTFASNEWRENLTANLIPDLSIYDIRDYRRFLSAHLQFLNGLCQLSIQAINDSVDQFLSSTLASAQIIPKTVLDLKIISLIKKSQSNAPIMFARLLFLLRATNHGNAIISAYGNNFEYIALRIYGGLTIVLKLLCPWIIRLVIKINKYRKKKQTNTVQPTNSIDMTTTATINTISDPTNVQGVNINLKLVPITATTETSCTSSVLRWLKSALWFVLLMIAAVIMIVISFYFIRQGKNQIVSTVSTCQLTFQPIVLYAVSGYGSYALAVSDFNGDGLSDVAVSMLSKNAMDVFLGNGNGTFKQRITGSASLSLDILKPFVVADFNNDGHLDLTAVKSFTGNLVSLLGNGNGNFGALIMLPNSVSDATISFIIPCVAVGDLNSDGNIDIVIAYSFRCKIGILFGYGNGNFTFETTLWMENRTCVPSVLIADFNRDGKQDIAISLDVENQVAVMLGYGNGSFDVPMMFSTGIYSFPSTIVANDFNGDGYLDIVVTNTGNHNIGVLLGKGNGDFQAQITSTTKVTFPPSLFSVGDFNGDGQLDIVTIITGDVTGMLPAGNVVTVLLGYDNGRFGEPITVQTGDVYPMSVNVGDFNSDGRMDIVVTGGFGFGVGILFNTCSCC
ncbi:unnamed protein product, partial [Adineta steineri]